MLKDLSLQKRQKRHASQFIHKPSIFLRFFYLFIFYFENFLPYKHLTFAVNVTLIITPNRTPLTRTQYKLIPRLLSFPSPTFQKEPLFRRHLRQMQVYLEQRLSWGLLMINQQKQNRKENEEMIVAVNAIYAIA